MTEEQENAALGQAIKDRQQAQQHLGLLIMQAHGYAESLRQLGELLANSPQDVYFQSASTNGKRVNPAAPQFKASDVDVNAIIKLTDDIRNTAERLERLDKATVRYGA